jgi:hypothetical protein
MTKKLNNKVRKEIEDSVINLISNNPGRLTTYLNENVLAVMNIHNVDANEAAEILMGIRLSDVAGAFDSEKEADAAIERMNKK